MQSAVAVISAGRSSQRRWLRTRGWRARRPSVTVVIAARSRYRDRMGLAAWSAASVSSRVGSVVALVEVTDDLMPGVVLPDARAAHGIPTQ